jgi:Tol biopolymer transport system component
MTRPLLCLALVGAVFAAQEPPASSIVTLTLTEGTSFSAAASPDRRWIAIDVAGGIWILPIAGGNATRITPDDLEARHPTWKPDSESIAFQGFGDDGVWHIYVGSREGENVRAVTSGEFDDREPAWSHDGARIAFSSDRYDGTVTICEVLVETHEVRRRSTRDGVMPAYSQNDRDIAFLSLDRETDRAQASAPRRPAPGIYTLDSNGRERLAAAVAGADAQAWSPDDTQFAFVTRDGNLALMDHRRPAVELLTRNEDVFPSQPQWLSRRELLYTAGGHIRWLTIGAGTVTIPFSATVKLTRNPYTISHRNLEPAGAQALRGVVRPAVSPDGRTIAFVALGDVWVMPIGALPIQITNDSAIDRDPAWSPDGARLAFASDRTGHMEIWVHDFTARIEQQVTHEDRSATHPAWSPDGNHIAFLLDRLRVGIVTVRPDSHPMRGPELLSHEAFGPPTWSVDNRVVAVGDLFPYSDRDPYGLNQLVFSAMDPAGASSVLVFRSHSAGDRESNGPVWSPDGSRFMFVTEGQLWTVNVDGSGAPTGPPLPAVTEEIPESPSWIGDSQHIVYQTPAGFVRMLSDGGSAEAIPLDLNWNPGAPPARVVVHAGHMVDGVLEALRDTTDIVIERGVIRTVTPHSDELHRGAVVDASDEVVMPGLIDASARVDPSEEREAGRAWLAYGVTSARTIGATTRSALEQRESIDSGRRAGPRLFVSGSGFGGIRQLAAGDLAVTSDDQLGRELVRSHTLGIDAFATGTRLPNRYARRLIAFAHEQGAPAIGTQIWSDVANGADAIDSLPPRAYRDVIDAIAKSGVTILPGLGLRGELDTRLNGDRRLLFDKRLALFPQAVVNRLVEIISDPPRAEREMISRPYEQTLGAIVAAGGKIAAASHAPILPYGLGLHVELESYVHAGLSPFQALQAATLNAAQLLGRAEELGTIEVGKLADLTFVSADPLIDIRNARDVTRVMKGGRLIAVADLISRVP